MGATIPKKEYLYIAIKYKEPEKRTIPKIRFANGPKKTIRNLFHKEALLKSPALATKFFS